LIAAEPPAAGETSADRTSRYAPDAADRARGRVWRLPQSRNGAVAARLFHSVCLYFRYTPSHPPAGPHELQYGTGYGRG
jgi:hypothetical protein